jgi:hypothetical protein
LRKSLQILFGAIFVILGAALLVLALRDRGASAGEAMIGPLALMGAGALAISSARRKPKKW